MPAMDDQPVRIGPWTRDSRRVAYENPWLTLWHDEVVRPDGQAGIYGVVHFRNVAAGIVAIDAQDRVALVGQHRYTLDDYSWEIPEGGVPEGEDPLAGAQARAPRGDRGGRLGLAGTCPRPPLQLRD